MKTTASFQFGPKRNKSLKIEIFGPYNKQGFKPIDSELLHWACISLMVKWLMQEEEKPEPFHMQRDIHKARKAWHSKPGKC